jgi:hypothetical protein
MKSIDRVVIEVNRASLHRLIDELLDEGRFPMVLLCVNYNDVEGNGASSVIYPAFTREQGDTFVKEAAKSLIQDELTELG